MWRGECVKAACMSKRDTGRNERQNVGTPPFASERARLDSEEKLHRLRLGAECFTDLLETIVSAGCEKTAQKIPAK